MTRRRCRPLRLLPLFGLTVFGLLGGSASRAWSQSAVVRGAAGDPTLQQQLDAWFRFAARHARGEWGVAVANENGQLIWGVSPTTPMIPASTVKVLTTGFARTVVGSTARKQTRVVGSGQLDPLTGTWLGTWALELSGDPSFEREGQPGGRLTDLAAQLAAQGVRKLTGPLSVLSDRGGGNADAHYPDVWSPRHRGRIFAPLIGSLTVHENVVGITVAPGARVGAAPVIVGEAPVGMSSLVTIGARTVAGRRARLRYQVQPGGRYTVLGTIGLKARPRTFTSVTSDPHAVLEAAWGAALKQVGIEWTRSSSVSAPTDLTSRTMLAVVNSPPFDSLAAEINRRSLNLGAELLLRWAAGGDSAAERLTAHVQQISGDYGVHLVDGSGLSSDDRVSPWTFVSYLARFPQLPSGKNFPMLLPANGTGTLWRLARGMPIRGVVRAKTGTLGNVASLVGYLGRQDGVLIVSLMYNGGHVWAARQAQWRLFRMLGADGVVIPSDSTEDADHLGGAERP